MTKKQLIEMIKRAIKEEYYEYKVGKPVKLALNGQNPKLYGMNSNEFRKLQAHDGQTAIITKKNDSDPEEWYYDLRFQDGYVVTNLSHYNLTKP